VPTDVLLVSLGSTSGLRASDEAFAAALRRAGAEVAVITARAPREVRTLVATDLVWARAARVAASRGVAAHRPRAVVYGAMGAALLWPRPGAIRFDAPMAGNRPGHHGLWQRPVERRRLVQAPLLIPVSPLTLHETPRPRADAIVVPIPVEASGAAARDGARDVAVVTYAANPHKKGLDRVLEAWLAARRGDEELWVTGVEPRAPIAGVRWAGRLPAPEYRALLRRARVFVTAPRREDYGIAQLEALADGCVLVTTPAPGAYEALHLARALDPRTVTPDGADDDPAALAAALRTALDAPAPEYASRATALLEPFSHRAVDATVAEQLLPRLLG
jgi:glycosyltransferase involved in cell wall biosynthesis